jgi:hypothetical protein
VSILEDPLEQDIKVFVEYFVRTVRDKWKKKFRSLPKMLKDFPGFFDQIVNFDKLPPPQPLQQPLQQPQPTKTKKSFDCMSKSHKLKSAQDIRRRSAPGAVVLAAHQVLRLEGHGDETYKSRSRS